MSKGKKILAASLAGVVLGAAAVDTWDWVWVFGIWGNRGQLNFEMAFEDLKNELTNMYAPNINGDILSDDPSIYSGQTDARCNPSTKANMLGLNKQSSTGAKLTAAQAVLTQLKGPASNGGFPSGGFAQFYGQLSRSGSGAGGVVSYTTGGTGSNVKLMTLILPDGSGATFGLGGTTAANSTVAGHIKDESAVTFHWDTGQPIDPTKCPNAQ